MKEDQKEQLVRFRGRGVTNPKLKGKEIIYIKKGNIICPASFYGLTNREIERIWDK